MHSLARPTTRLATVLLAALCLQVQAADDVQAPLLPYWRTPLPTKSASSPPRSDRTEPAVARSSSADAPDAPGTTGAAGTGAISPDPAATLGPASRRTATPATSRGPTSAADAGRRVPEDTGRAAPTGSRHSPFPASSTRIARTRRTRPAAWPGPVAAPDRDAPFHAGGLPDRFDAPALGAASGTAEPETPPAPTVLAPWLAFDGPSANARQLLEWIEDAGAHGLNPARYDLDGLHEGIAAVFEATPPRLIPSSPHAARAALAYRFRRAFTRLATDLGRGVVDARAVQSRLYRDRPDPDVHALRSALARGELDANAALARVVPAHASYTRLNEAMRARLAERAAGRTRTRVDPLGSLWVGHRHADVMRIKARLIETGELHRGTVLTPMFDADLVLAVEAFQRRNGIAPGGVVDPRTRAALNRTLEEELDALALSLERWRWMPRELGARHVIVNLPDYRLQLHNGTQRIVDMPVVIGDVDHPTPSFSRDLSYMEFNPTWTVPASIANKELVPIERRSPGYLKSRRFDFLEHVDGRLEKVPYDSVTAADLRERPFPYVLRQRSGPNNALGRMKFMMPNPYAIYLHDTQAKRHFTLHERAYSHGCIRLSDPDRLASLLMQIDGKSLDEVDRVLATRKTSRVPLRAPVPTHLVYFTTWVDEHGALQRRADVYGHDPALRIALQAHEALPSAWLPPSERGAGVPG